MQGKREPHPTLSVWNREVHPMVLYDPLIPTQEGDAGAL